MITLITGAPGAGKTAALVSMLAELGKDRPLYVHGIPELKVSHVTLDQPDTWPETVPDGAVVIIDEVQTVWRPSGPGQKIPDHIAKLETHRHRGLDFYIITQGPNLVHSNVRALVGRHVHLRDVGILGRWWYEWPETADNCRTGWKTAPIKKRYRLPKQIFGTYKSASIHVKPVRGFPRVLAVLALALVGVGVLGWNTWGTVQKKMDGGKLPATVTGAPASTTASVAMPSAQAQATPPAGPADERTDFLPRLSDRPWTAPAFDHLRQVVRMPTIAGGICKGSECVCVTEHGERLDVSAKACAAWISARPFDPYNVPKVIPAAAAARADKSSAGIASSEHQTAQPPQGTVNVVPLPAAAMNPRAELEPRVPILPRSERAQAMAARESSQL